MVRSLCALLLLMGGAARGAGSPASYQIATVAGTSLNGDGGPAVAAQLGAIQGVAADAWGNLYLSDTDNHRVRKVTAAGIISTIAGTGAAGFGGDGGPAAAAQLNLPYGLAVDAAGNLYIADLGNDRIRRVAPNGTISTYAGGGAPGADSDGGPAASAVLRTPRNVTLDAAGNLYLSEFEGHRVRKVTPDGHIATVAGSGVAGFGGDGGSAASAQLNYPAGLAMDRAGNLYIADSANQRIRRIWVGGAIATVAGPAAPALVTPTAVAVDAGGALYISDAGASIHYCASQVCSTLAGGAGPGDLALDSTGNLYVAEGTSLRKIAAGEVTTIAGDGYLHAIGDGGPAGAAQLSQPSAVALDGAGDLFIADTGTERIRQVLPSGVIQTVAGTGVADAAPADLHAPAGVAVDSSGAVWIADTGNHRIRKAVHGVVAAAAGTGTAGSGPEGLAPLATALNGPRGVCLDSAGGLYIVDTGNHRVLRIAGSGMLQTAAGNGSPGSAGDGGAARLAQLNSPSACAFDAAGSLYIADTGSHRIRKVTPDGVIATVAGTGIAGAGGDGGPAIAAALNGPRGVAVDGNGNLFLSDTGNNSLRLVTADGNIQTIATASDVQFPGGLAIDPAGNVYVADTGNNRVRLLTPQSAQPLPAQSLSVVNAASLAAGAVSPGEIVSIFGAGLGPAAAVTAAFDSNGSLPTRLGGVQVEFDGVAAPLFYAQAGQINAQAPYSLEGATTHVQVLLQGSPVGWTDLAVAPSAPALFAGLNTAGNPAPRGSVVVFYATGEGLTTGPNVSGQAAAAPYPQPLLPVTLSVQGVSAQLLYAGSAPGTAGVLQVNAVIPGGFLPAGAATVRLSVGSAISPPLTIWVQ